MKQFELLLRDRIGLDSASVGGALIERNVRLRMKAVGLKTADEYREYLQKVPAEWVELVENLVITETWFFRDRHPFRALVEFAQEPVFQRPLRILSLPCSSGEEPYSIAMALLDAGFSPSQFKIDAIDISQNAIQRAQAGLYTRNSFRGQDLDYRKKYFQRVNDRYLLSPVIRELVQFSTGNVLGADFRTCAPNYDFVFCRNLLIYFDRATQARALARLSGLLSPAGILFTGPAEQGLILEFGSFVSTNVEMASAFRKKAINTSSHHVAPLPAQAAATHAFTPASRADSGFIPVRLSIAADGMALKSARLLADAGRLNEAAVLCEEYLRRHGPSAQAYYLLGLVRDAHSDGRARDYYRRALYLQPDHYESLVQMSLLAQKDGDLAAARNFRERAARVHGHN